MIKKNNTSWGGVAKWYDSLLKMDGTYQKDVILPNLLKLMGVRKGEKVLDIACGQGFFARALADKGADVTGVDISPELIKFAKEKAGGNEKYFVASADNFFKEMVRTNFVNDEKLNGQGFDKAIIVLAIQNIENLNGTLAEAARALKVGGKLFLVLNHPIFRNPKKTSWGYDAVGKIQYRRVDEYLSESKSEIDMTPGTGNESKKKNTISFHRPLQLYFNALVENSFLLGRLEELVSNKKSETGPRQKAEDKARKEIPLFMIIEAIKQ